MRIVVRTAPKHISTLGRTHHDSPAWSGPLPHRTFFERQLVVLAGITSTLRVHFMQCKGLAANTLQQTA
jgi:hypothetical protein